MAVLPAERSIQRRGERVSTRWGGSGRGRSRAGYLSGTASGWRLAANCVGNSINAVAVFRQEKQGAVGLAESRTDHRSRPQRNGEYDGVEHPVDKHRREESIRLMIHPPEDNAHERIVDSHVGNDDWRG